MTQKLTFDIAIPVLNEERHLEKQITTLVSFFNDTLNNLYFSTFTVTIADNGSTDNTILIAKELAKKYPNAVRYLSINKVGPGLAIKEAWQTSKAEIVGYMDLDFSIELDKLSVVIDAIVKDSYLFAYCSRAHKDSIVLNKKWYRRILSKGVNVILSTYLKTHIQDPTGSPKLFYKKYLNGILEIMGPPSPSFWFNGQVFIVAEALGLKLKNLPVKWIDHPSTSQIKILAAIKQMLKDITSFKPYLDHIKKNKKQLIEKYFSS